MVDLAVAQEVIVLKEFLAQAQLVKVMMLELQVQDYHLQEAVALALLLQMRVMVLYQQQEVMVYRYLLLDHQLLTQAAEAEVGMGIAH
jgi:hypothetical protein